MGDNNKQALDRAVSIIPKPVSIKVLGGTLNLKTLNEIKLAHASEPERSVSRLFQKLLEPIKEYKVTKNTIDVGKIFIDLDPSLQMLEEEYKLVVGKNKSTYLTAKTPSGLFYGFQTFRQLCPPELEKGEKPTNTSIANLIIEDFPRFGYRGMHLDVSRHFFNVDFIKTYIDMIALHKMNVFHWHLTDDNGWRIEIDRYPDLIKKSAWRVDREHENWKEWSPIKPGEKPSYGGYYTKEEIKEVVQHADKNHITIIPEIEMPGHTSEVFAAYPELSCRGDTLNVVPGAYWPNVDIFCAGNDEVLIFLKNVLSEVIELFPGPYIHIGGDEADKTRWEECSKCQKRIKTENLHDEKGLQSWFIRQIEPFITSKNKKLIGWDEILEGGLAPNATVMSWRGTEGAVISAKRGHDVVMCPTSHCYFDYYQADPAISPEAFGGYITLKKVYSFSPVPEGLTKNESKHILGAQGNLWTEFVKTKERAQYRVLPRMTALAEVVWSPEKFLMYDSFYKRLLSLQKRFDVLGWTYAPGSFEVSIQANKKTKSSEYKISLSSEKPGTPIFFTLDGTTPTISSSRFVEPFFINKSTDVKAALLINNKQLGSVSEKAFYFHKALGRSVKYLTSYQKRYSGEGQHTLVDGLVGTEEYSDGHWQGWEGDSMDVVVDLKKKVSIVRVSIGFLESIDLWIFLPTRVVVSFSNSGREFTNEKTIQLSSGAPLSPPKRIAVKFSGPRESYRYVRVQAENMGVCPEWHPGGGGRSWVFSDEIIIE